jgi:hypothetical protein
MQETKVYKILMQFSKIEQNRLRKFVQSPYFNRDEVIHDLNELILDDINRNTAQVFEKEKVWKKLGLKTPYDDVRMRKYYSDLLKLVEEFLVQQAFENDLAGRQAYLIQSLRKKKLNALHNSVVKNVDQLPERNPYRDSQFFHGQYLVESNFEKYLDSLEQTKTEKTNLEKISRNLDLFYLGEKLRILCSVSSKKRLAKVEYHIDLANDVLGIAEREMFTSTPLIAIYLQILKMSEFPDELEHYERFKELVKEYSALFDKEEAKSFYDGAQNYCIAQLNRGRSHFSQEYLQLFQEMLEKDLVLKDGALESQVFRNVVTVGLRSGDFAYIEQFIQDFKSKLPADVQENVYSFSIAQLYFYQKKYNKVIQTLQSVEYADYTFNINSKNFLLVTYYEMDEHEPLLALLESMRVYLNRNSEIPEDRKINFKNLIKYTKKLVSLPPGNRKAVEELKQEVEATGTIASRNWLLEKIAEREKERR